MRVPAEKLDVALTRLGQKPFAAKTDPVRVVTTQSMATTIIGQLGLTYEVQEPQKVDEKGIRQVDLLLEWLQMSSPTMTMFESCKAGGFVLRPVFVHAAEGHEKDQSAGKAERP